MDQTTSAPIKPAAIRPSDAATLIIVRQASDAVSVLMGRRSSKSVFMPGKLVFPGGRVEKRDRSARSADSLDPTVEGKLLNTSRKIDPGRARAIAMAAIRETFEETGIMIGMPCPQAEPKRAGAKTSGAAWAAFAAAGLAPSIGGLRFFSRAITPPGQSRRFDARFFVISADAIALTTEPLDRELEEPVWLTIEDARSRNLARITLLVLDDLEARIRNGQLFDPGAPVVFRQPTRAGIGVSTLL